MEIDLFEAGLLEWPELWRPVKGWEGIYEVSDKGRIRRLVTRGGNQLESPIVLKCMTDRQGYKHVYLMRNEKKKEFLVHRLVMLAFVENPNNYGDINHKDENPSNNCVYNLEWCSRRYNLNYGNHNKNLSESLNGKFINRKDLSKQVEKLDIDGNLIMTYPSISEASRQSGVYISSISCCCSGKYKQAGGYVWRYAE